MTVDIDVDIRHAPDGYDYSRHATTPVLGAELPQKKPPWHKLFRAQHLGVLGSRTDRTRSWFFLVPRPAVLAPIAAHALSTEDEDAR